MQQVEKRELIEKRDRKKKMESLLDDPNFKDIFINYFLKSTIHELMYREGSSQGVMKELDARKVFNDFMYNIIDSGKNAEEQLKGQ